MSQLFKSRFAWCVWVGCLSGCQAWVAPDCDDYGGYEGEIGFRASDCVEIIEGVQECGTFAVSLPETDAPVEIPRDTFAALVPNGSVRSARLEWDENGCFDQAHFSHIDGEGDASLKGVHLVFQGTQFGERVTCCRCEESPCTCDVAGDEVVSEKPQGCSGLGSDEQCMLCVSNATSTRRCIMTLSWPGLSGAPSGEQVEESSELDICSAPGGASDDD